MDRIEIIQPIAMIFGLTPFNRMKMQSNIFIDSFWMIVVPAFYLSCYYRVAFGTYGIYRLATCDSICRLSNRLFVHLGCFLYLCIAFLAIFRRKNFFGEFEERLTDIDEFIKKCQKLTNDKYQAKKHLRAYYMTWLLLIIIFGGIMIHDAFVNAKNYDINFYVVHMVTFFPYFAASIAQGQFIYYVAIIARRFKQLNSLFQKINHECDKKNAPISVFDIETDAKKHGIIKAGDDHLKQVKTVETNNVSSDEDDDDDDDDDDEDNDAEQRNNEKNGFEHSNDGSTSESNLPQLFKLHDKILALCTVTNAEFGPQCVPYMAVCFVISIFGIFLETKVMFIVGGKSPTLDYVVYTYVVWSLATIVTGYLVLRFCCNTNSASKQSAMIVHEIMQKKPTFMLGNDLYYNKMKSFTLQFLHWEGYFQFNGIGLFALDYTFIFSTVSAATSYLIVLLQFDMGTILKTEGLM